MIKLLLCLLVCVTRTLWAHDSSCTQTEVIHGGKDGMALTRIAAVPKGKSNGKSIVQVISGVHSSYIQYLDADQAKSFIATLFAVGHGSQRSYTISDAIADIQRAVRYIKYHAKHYRVVRHEMLYNSFNQSHFYSKSIKP